MGEVTPRHGPGATADRKVGNRKYDVDTWTRRLEDNYFPAADFMIPNYGFINELQSITLHDSGAELPVRVITVPKTLKAPRIIAIEPTCMMYAQQALLEQLVELLESDNHVQGMINFTDQTQNQELARLSSRDGSLATLDLSEASDRVSLRLVTRLLKPYPALTRAVMACRSKVADVPGHGKIRLAKFASMGSALCFPMEAMVFLTLVLLGIQKERRRSLTYRDLKEIAKSVRVYGDDIICHTNYARSVITTLETYGLKVNVHKSFLNGLFRESCGGEYYDGLTVKPVKLTKVPPRDRRDVDEFISFVSHRNQLYEAGLWETAKYADRLIEKICPFPTVGKDSPALGRWSFLKRVSEERWDSALQRWLVKAYVVHAPIPISQLDDHAALMKFFLKRGEEPIFMKDHLKRSGRPKSVYTRLRWVPSV